MTGEAIVIRRVETQAEYDECVRIQDETWGAGFSERVPSAILKVAQYLGGVAAAAFDTGGSEERMLGFVFGMTGMHAGQLVHWSDMLAVRPDARDHGIGRRLKLYQRSLVAELGVRQMLWTFDPLVSRNAHLNLNTLGARVTEYVPDMYGSDTGSALHEGIGTDRFVVAWSLTDEPGASTGHGRAPQKSPAVSLVVNRGTSDSPKDAPELFIAIPEDIQNLIATAPTTARAWRESTRAAFLRYMAHGYRVTGFHRSDGSGFYRLTRGMD